eukprot:g5339.t1
MPLPPDMLAPVNEAATAPLHVLILTLCQRLQVRSDQAIELLSRNSHFLQHMLSSGINGDLAPIISWCRALHESAPKLAALLCADDARNELPVVLHCLRDILLSKDREIAIWGCHILSKTISKLDARARSTPAWRWFISPESVSNTADENAIGAEQSGLHAVVVCMQTHPSSVAAAWKLMRTFCTSDDDEGVTAGRLSVLLCNSLQKYCITPRAYLGIILSLLKRIADDPVISRRAEEEGVLRKFTEYALTHADSPAPHGSVEASADPLASPVASARSVDSETVVYTRIAAIELISDLWITFPEVFGTRPQASRLALAMLKKACRDPMLPLQVAAASVMFRMLFEFAQSGNKFAAYLYKTMVFSLIESSTDNESFHEFQVSNMSVLLQTVPQLPVNVMIEPLIKQVALSGYNNRDFEFFLAIAKHDRLDEMHALLLADLLGKVALNDPIFSRTACIPLLTMLKRFEEDTAVTDYTVRLFKVGLTQLLQVEAGAVKILRAQPPNMQQELENYAFRRIMAEETLYKILQLDHMPATKRILPMIRAASAHYAKMVGNAEKKQRGLEILEHTATTALANDFDLDGGHPEEGTQDISDTPQPTSEAASADVSGSSGHEVDASAGVGGSDIRSTDLGADLGADPGADPSVIPSEAEGDLGIALDEQALHFQETAATDAAVMDVAEESMVQADKAVANAHDDDDGLASHSGLDKSSAIESSPVFVKRSPELQGRAVDDLDFDHIRIDSPSISHKAEPSPKGASTEGGGRRSMRQMVAPSPEENKRAPGPRSSDSPGPAFKFSTPPARARRSSRSPALGNSMSMSQWRNAEKNKRKRVRTRSKQAHASSGAQKTASEPASEPLVTLNGVIDGISGNYDEDCQRAQQALAPWRRQLRYVFTEYARSHPPRANGATFDSIAHEKARMAHKDYALLLRDFSVIPKYVSVQQSSTIYKRLTASIHRQQLNCNDFFICMHAIVLLHDKIRDARRAKDPSLSSLSMLGRPISRGADSLIVRMRDAAMKRFADYHSRVMGGSLLHADCKAPSGADPKVWKPRELPEDEISSLNQLLAEDPQTRLPSGVFKEHILVRDLPSTMSPEAIVEEDRGKAAEKMDIVYSVLDDIMNAAIGIPMFPQRVIVKVRSEKARSKEMKLKKGGASSSPSPVERPRKRFTEVLPLSGTARQPHSMQGKPSPKWSKESLERLYTVDKTKSKHKKVESEALPLAFGIRMPRFGGDANQPQAKNSPARPSAGPAPSVCERLYPFSDLNAANAGGEEEQEEAPKSGRRSPILFGKSSPSSSEKKSPTSADSALASTGKAQYSHFRKKKKHAEKKKEEDAQQRHELRMAEAKRKKRNKLMKARLAQLAQEKQAAIEAKKNRDEQIAVRKMEREHEAAVKRQLEKRRLRRWQAEQKKKESEKLSQEEKNKAKLRADSNSRAMRSVKRFDQEQGWAAKKKQKDELRKKKIQEKKEQLSRSRRNEMAKEARNRRQQRARMAAAKPAQSNAGQQQQQKRLDAETLQLIEDELLDLDTETSGFVSTESVRSVLSSHGIYSSDVKALLSAATDGGDDEIDYNEFLTNLKAQEM